MNETRLVQMLKFCPERTWPLRPELLLIALPSGVSRIAVYNGYMEGLFQEFFSPKRRRNFAGSCIFLRVLWLVPLDRHDQLFLQVDFLSFPLVQKSPVTSTALNRAIATAIGASWR